MGFSLGSIAQALLLCLNAMAILSERRLLSKYGLATPAVMDHLRGSGEGGTVGGDGGFVPLAFGPGDEFLRVHQSSPFKMQLASVLTSVRTLLRWPLILINTGMILFILVFG